MTGPVGGGSEVSELPRIREEDNREEEEPKVDSEAAVVSVTTVDISVWVVFDLDRESL